MAWAMAGEAMSGDEMMVQAGEEAMAEAGEEMAGDNTDPDPDPNSTTPEAGASMMGEGDDKGGAEFAQAERVSDGCNAQSSPPQASLILLLLMCPLLNRRLRRRA